MLLATLCVRVVLVHVALGSVIVVCVCVYIFCARAYVCVRVLGA